MVSECSRMFGEEFWKSVVLVFTRWDFSSEGDARRLKSGNTLEGGVDAH